MLAVTVNWELLNRYQGLASSGTFLPVVVVIAVSAWLIIQFRAWFRENDGHDDDSLEMLSQFRDLRQQGELSEDEYRLIKSQLVQAATKSEPGYWTVPETAKDAANDVPGKGGTEKTGEAGLNDAEPCESRRSDESPNLNSPQV